VKSLCAKAELGIPPVVSTLGDGATVAEVVDQVAQGRGEDH
jgi:hypothetical protein